MKEEVQVTPEELYYLGKCMQAKFIDYAYIAAMNDIQQNYTLQEQRSLETLEEKELIVRTKDADDRRASLITLKADSLPERERPDFFAALSEEEKEQLKTLLKKVLQNRIPE